MYIELFNILYIYIQWITWTSGLKVAFCVTQPSLIDSQKNSTNYVKPTIIQPINGIARAEHARGSAIIRSWCIAIMRL